MTTEAIERGEFVDPAAVTASELVERGLVVAIPTDYVVSDHPGAAGPTAYLATEPLRLADEAGTIRSLGAGDLVSASEARASRTALAGLLHRRQVVALPADRGIVAGLDALLDRARRVAA